MYDKNSPDLRVLIQELLDARRLSSPVGFDGATFTASAIEPVPHASGWDFPHATIVGGLQSAAVEATRVELIGAGFEKIATRIPRFHVGQFWHDPDQLALEFATSDPTRFSLPKSDAEAHGLTLQQLEQIQDNVEVLDGLLFVRSTMGPHFTEYRGERGKSGFAPVDRSTDEVDFSPAPAPDYRPDVVDAHWPQGAPVYSYARVPNVDRFGNPRGNYKRVQQGLFADHWVYSVGWDLRDDANVNRFWRNLAISFGASIPLEPGN